MKNGDYVILKEQYKKSTGIRKKDLDNFLNYPAKVIRLGDDNSVTKAKDSEYFL